MLEHEIRQGCPWITDLLFQEAGDPQPRAVASAFVLEGTSIGPPASLQGIEIDPLPWQRGS